MKITFAFALDKNDLFKATHFGNSDKFAIYTETGKEIVLNEEIVNTFKDFGETQQHGSLKKGNAIISLLKEKGVNVLVSKRFGQNISLINNHFIPVIIREESPDEVLSVIKKHKKWLKDELKNKKGNYMLFQISSGVLKLSVKSSE